MTVHALQADGVLTIEGAESSLRGWLPTHAAPAPRGRVHLVVEGAPLGVVRPSLAPTLSLLDIEAWVDGDAVLLKSASGDQDGVLELAGPGGTLGITPGVHAEPLLTIATALLLGRMGRALVHGAAVVAPDQRARLLVGDTHAGKSTTTATLAQAGWPWLADDQVVLWEEGGVLQVEGWARRPNLDVGYAKGEVTGERGAAEFARGATAGAVPFGGVVIPSVVADAPTTCRPATASDAFTALVRQSPWLLADTVVAATVHQLLVAAASRAAVHLSLGRDSYGDGERLASVLGEGLTLKA